MSEKRNVRENKKEIPGNQNKNRKRQTNVNQQVTKKGHRDIYR